MKLSGKPNAAYKGRMEKFADEKWLIWSNKWGCWYRSGSSGYTSDIANAGIYDRNDAILHYDGPERPRKYRDTEPFPLSVVRKHIDIVRRQTILDFEKRMNAIDKLLEITTADKSQLAPK